MRWIVDGTKIVPHPEEAAQRPSRRTHIVDAIVHKPSNRDQMAIG
jgi:hypothetical protein